MCKLHHNERSLRRDGAFRIIARSLLGILGALRESLIRIVTARGNEPKREAAIAAFARSRRRANSRGRRGESC